MIRPVLVILTFFCFTLFSCAVNRVAYSPAKKYPEAALQKDYTLLRAILEKKHPGVYWYTSRDSMDYYFDKYYAAIGDSMTEQQFAWHVLAPMVEKIRCGHTSVSSSKAYVKAVSGRRFPSFPLYMKVWSDTMAVLANLDRKDSIFKRGTLITSINGVNNRDQIIKMFGYLPQDGFANNVNYIRLSGNFPYYHRSIYGLSKNYNITYLDSNGVEKSAVLPLYTPVKDTSKKVDRPKEPEISKERRRLRYRSFEIDSTGKFATMTVNTFSKGNLRGFFRRSFRTLRKKNINNLVLDLRSNGGGKVTASTLLTKYISRTPFKVADSLYASTRGLGKYSKYVKAGIFNNIEMFFISSKRKDGKYHLGHLERKTYHPKSKNHYDGKLYVLINGPTFSASSLFCNVVKGQEGITLVGEETGGGWHGNNGIMIPDIKLPITGLRVRLPLYRLVQFNHIPRTGTGILPDVYVGTNYNALIKGVDYKMEVVRKMILETN